MKDKDVCSICGSPLIKTSGSTCCINGACPTNKKNCEKK